MGQGRPAPQETSPLATPCLVVLDFLPQGRPLPRLGRMSGMWGWLGCQSCLWNPGIGEQTLASEVPGPYVPGTQGNLPQIISIYIVSTSVSLNMAINDVSLTPYSGL